MNDGGKHQAVLGASEYGGHLLVYNAVEKRHVALGTGKAGGKVNSAKVRGKPIPEGWLTDGEGLPTTGPSVFLAEGALTPFVAHKGYGLAMLVELFAGVLAGAGMTSDILSWAIDPNAPVMRGMHSLLSM